MGVSVVCFWYVTRGLDCKVQKFACTTSQREPFKSKNLSYKKFMNLGIWLKKLLRNLDLYQIIETYNIFIVRSTILNISNFNPYSDDSMLKCLAYI